MKKEVKIGPKTSDEDLVEIVALELTDPKFDAAAYQAAYGEMERRRRVARGQPA